MKCRYRFPVRSRIKPSTLHPVKVGDSAYSFFADSGFIDRVEVIVPADPEQDVPKVDMLPDTRPVTGIQVRHPKYDEILHSLRVTEGLLSLYGMIGIDFERMHIEWIPETEEEKNSTIINSLSLQYTDRSVEESSTTPFDLLARGLLSASNASATEISLTFYRRGTNDMRERRYIEAFYDFYFMLESLFGQGKSKNYAIEEEFKKNSSLLDAIKKTIVAFRPPQGEPLIAKNFDEHYKGKHPEEVVERFVTIRGFLHHHNPKRTGMWHPERQEEHEVDSLIMQGVCFSLASD